MGCAVLARAQAAATAPAMVNPADAKAQALGYVADAAKVDKAKYLKYAAGQVCSNCALFQGKAADPAGGCPLFAGKQVAGKGWRSQPTWSRAASAPISAAGKPELITHTGIAARYEANRPFASKRRLKGEVASRLTSRGTIPPPM